MSRPRTLDHDAIVQMWLDGVSYRQIAAKLGLWGPNTVGTIIRRLRDKGAVIERRSTDVVVPKWVPADLADEFLDIAAEEGGEEIAASRVRRLKHEAERVPV